MSTSITKTCPRDGSLRTDTILKSALRRMSGWVILPRLEWEFAVCTYRVLGSLQFRANFAACSFVRARIIRTKDHVLDPQACVQDRALRSHGIQYLVQTGVANALGFFRRSFEWDASWIRECNSFFSPSKLITSEGRDVLVVRANGAASGTHEFFSGKTFAEDWYIIKRRMLVLLCITI